MNTFADYKSYAISFRIIYRFLHRPNPKKLRVVSNLFYYQKHLFIENRTTLQIITDQIPAKAGIDPYLVLIDREMEDNVCEVKEADDSLVSFLLSLPIKAVVEYNMTD